MESFIELQCDKIVNVRLMLSYTLANLFEKNEEMQQATDGSPELPRSNSLGPLQKVYTNSILCTDQRVLNMVRRLRVDSNRDIQRSLRHIHLADDSSPD